MARMLYQARAQGIPPLPDVAWVQAPQIPGRPLARAHLGPALAMPTQQPVPPADSWLPPVAPATILAAPRVRQSEIIAPAMQPVPPADSWLGAIQQPIMVPQRAQQPEALVAPTRQPEPPADGWLPATNLPPRGALRFLEALRQFLALPARQPEPSWGWEARGPGQFPPVPRMQLPGAVWPLYVEPPPPPPDFGWWRPASEPSPHQLFRAFLYGGATLLYAPSTPVIIARPGRVLPLMLDFRDILLSPDIRTIILPLDEAPMPPAPPQYWSPASGSDEDFYWLSLTQWIPPEDTIVNPSAEISPIEGDETPLEVVPDSVVVDAGDRRVYVPPGVPIIDPGPRIQMKLRGGSLGKTYTTTISWQDSQGRTMNRQVLLTIQWP